ncbi:hypothetical protein [Geodermatophilus sp. URMC 64]
MAATDQEKGANGISAFAVRRDDPGFAVGSKETKTGITGSPTCELYSTDCAIPADRIIGAEGTGSKAALRTLGFTRPTIGAQAVGSPRARWTPRWPTSMTASSSAPASAPSRACSSRSPTWR